MRDMLNRKQGTSSPCAACKLLRRRCAEDCVFSPYFPANEPQKFAHVHKIFGASNVNKMLQELPAHHRSDAVSSMVYEANARIRDPVYGCVGAISSLQQHVNMLQTQLAVVKAEVIHLQMREAACLARLSQSCVSGHRGGDWGSDKIGITTMMQQQQQQAKFFDEKKVQLSAELGSNVDGGSNLGEPMWSC